MNESRELKNAEQLEELLLLTEEIQEELEQKDQLIVELKTQLNESLTLNEKLNKENRAGNIQALKNDLKLADRALRSEKEKLRSANVTIEECQDMLIYSLLSVQTEVGISILVSSFMALIEFTIIFFNITIVEKTNIPKSLKGGCL